MTVSPTTPTLLRPAATARSVAARPVHGARAPWTRRYARLLAASDTVVVGAAVTAGQLLWFGTGATRTPVAPGPALTVSLAEVSLLLAATWLGVLVLLDARDEREIGAGVAEYQRIARAGLVVTALAVVSAFFLGLDLSRAWVATTVPVGTGLLLGSRWAWRRWLRRRRAVGAWTHRVVLIGSGESVARTARDLAREPGHAYRVVGVALTDGPAGGEFAGLPVVGEVDEVPGLLDALGADTVMATSTDHLPSERLRDLAWHLAPRRHALVVAPGLADVGGSRMHLRPVAGLPLIHVEVPHYVGLKRVLKRLFDVLVSAAALVVLAPAFAVIAVLIRRDSAGGVFYTQERVGRNGESFRILKFRSMVADADQRRAALVEGLGKGLFKMTSDPRVTPVGAVLRRFSLDELPQLVNVLRGDMSLVGPRPALPSEVSEYDRRELRRLAVTPGLSGLWQVSGRSDLGWADGIRLDLYYVENWSLTQDLAILWRTARAVLTSSGAY